MIGLARRLATGRRSRVGLVILGGIVAAAILAPLISPYDPSLRVTRPFHPPSGEHLLGTNDVGQDILSELIHGARISLTMAIAAGTLATILGTFVGIISGYAGRFVDATLMRTTDVVLVIPFIPLLIVLAAYVGRGSTAMVLIIGALLWAPAARVIRSRVLSTRHRLYVDAARTYGSGTPAILRRHILPGVAPLVIMEFIHLVKVAVLLEASLSFLGLGDPTVKSWGTMLHYATARGAFLTGAWLWWIVPPGAAIALVVVAFAFVGMGFEEEADPRLVSVAEARG